MDNILFNLMDSSEYRILLSNDKSQYLLQDSNITKEVSGSACVPNQSEQGQIDKTTRAAQDLVKGHTSPPFRVIKNEIKVNSSHNTTLLINENRQYLLQDSNITKEVSSCASDPKESEHGQFNKTTNAAQDLVGEDTLPPFQVIKNEIQVWLLLQFFLVVFSV